MIRAIAFDAVGTLIHPEPPVWTVYAEVAQRFGSRLDVGEIRRRFRTAFAEQERRDWGGGLRTSEEREKQRWAEIVAAVLDDVTDPETCFAALYQHFAEPHAWRPGPDVAAVLAELRQRGYRLALASNFDHRLRAVWAGLPELDAIVVSSEVGWRKPAAGFFQALGDALQLPPAAILLVGDDRVNDYDGAVAAGLHAVLLDANSTGPHVISSLRNLLTRPALSPKTAER